MRRRLDLSGSGVWAMANPWKASSLDMFLPIGLGRTALWFGVLRGVLGEQ